MKLMSSRLDPTSSTTDSATSPTISAARKRPARSLDDPRALSFSTSTSRAFDACSAGTRPTRSALISVTPPVKTSARQLSVRIVLGGSCAAMVD